MTVTLFFLYNDQLQKWWHEKDVGRTACCRLILNKKDALHQSPVMEPM